jgi:nicotinamidase-related amidase
MITSLLDSKNTAMVVVDMQDKLIPLMGRKDRLLADMNTLLRLATLFEIPIVLTEQYTKWLGTTIPDVKESLPLYDPIHKMAFNCCEVDDFNRRLESHDAENIILAGIETHICVYQTCFSLLKRGYQVHVPQDAVDSRTDENRRVGLGLMRDAGAVLTSTETIVYQVLKRAGTKEFKTMLRMIR